MDGIAKAEQQKQEPGFVSEGNGEAFNMENNDKGLPAVPTGDETPQPKAMHAAFTSKSPAPLLFTHSDLQRNTQQFVDDINAKRKRDADSLAEVRKALEMQATTTGNLIEETLVGIYEENSKVIQDKLQEIFAVLDRISNLEGELSEFKQALGLFYQDVRPLNQS